MSDPQEPKSEELRRLFWRDEILQLFFWLEGEGFGDLVGPRTLERFMGVDTEASVVHLEQLAEDGVASHWETSATGPARRVYRLTGAGRRALDESAASLAETQTVVAAYLVRHTSLAPGREASNDGRTAPPGARSRAGSGRPDHASTRPAKSQPATLDA